MPVCAHLRAMLLGSKYERSTDAFSELDLRSFGLVQVHALIGENGGGKSTTMKIVSGYLVPTWGALTLNSAPVSFANAQGG